MKKVKRASKKRNTLRVLLLFIVSMFFVGVAAAVALLGINYMENQKFRETFYCVSSWKVNNKVRVIQISDLHNCAYGDGNSELIRWRKALAEQLNIRPMNEYDGSPIYKIVIMCRKAEQLKEARSLLEKDYEFCIQEIPDHANCQNGELINRAFDKGRGILRIAEKLNVGIEDVYGFGDSMNDLTMIQTVGTGVCMDNGAETLKKLSDLVVPSVKEDGLFRGFEQLGLI